MRRELARPRLVPETASPPPSSARDVSRPCVDRRARALDRLVREMRKRVKLSKTRDGQDANRPFGGRKGLVLDGFGFDNRKMQMRDVQDEMEVERCLAFEIRTPYLPEPDPHILCPTAEAGGVSPFLYDAELWGPSVIPDCGEMFA